eukprot:1196324-Prorocentrum_minimum.AAC.2
MVSSPKVVIVDAVTTRTTADAACLCLLPQTGHARVQALVGVKRIPAERGGAPPADEYNPRMNTRSAVDGSDERTRGGDERRRVLFPAVK